MHDLEPIERRLRNRGQRGQHEQRRAGEHGEHPKPRAVEYGLISSLFPYNGGIEWWGAKRFLDSYRITLDGASYANILDRLATGHLFSRSDEPWVRNDLGHLALKQFLQAVITRTPEDTASVCRSAEILGLLEKPQYTLTRTVKKLLPFCAPKDIITIVSAFNSYSFRKASGDEANETLRTACRSFQQCAFGAEHFDPVCVIDFLCALSRGNIRHPEILLLAIERMEKPTSTGVSLFDTLSLDDKCRLLVCSLNMGHPLPTQYSAVTAEIYDLVQRNFEAGTLSLTGIGDYARYACLQGSSLGKDELEILAGRFYDEVSRIAEGPSPGWALRLVPAVALISGPPNRRADELLGRGEQLDSSFFSPSPFEETVRDILGRGRLQVRREARFGPYSLDFLISFPGVLVNLEADGDFLHLMYDLSEAKLTREYSVKDQVRDRFISGYHRIPVARVLASQLPDALSEPKKEQLIVGIIRDAVSTFNSRKGA